jgi:hypothetical protein
LNLMRDLVVREVSGVVVSENVVSFILPI